MKASARAAGPFLLNSLVVAAAVVWMRAEPQLMGPGWVEVASALLVLGLAVAAVAAVLAWRRHDQAEAPET